MQQNRVAIEPREAAAVDTQTIDVLSHQSSRPDHRIVTTT
jgi:hypothetical protein